MADAFPMVPVGTAADSVSARLVRSRFAEGNPLVIVVASETGTGTSTVHRTQIVVPDCQAAEGLARELMAAASAWRQVGHG